MVTTDLRGISVLIISNTKDLKIFLRDFRNSKPDHKIGFVPTMGALHQGHLSLIKEAKEICDFVVTSIFVNPTQFNNINDLERYPRTPEKDAVILKDSGCDLLFLPSEADIYPEGVKDYEINLSPLDEILEGKFRPGHFKGVAMVVERFFRIVEPDFAFFGEKDYQQIAIIRKMTQLRSLDVRINTCPTYRSENGLALSSRNELLRDSQKEEALIIYKTLKRASEKAEKGMNTTDLREDLIQFFDQGNLNLEYLEIVNEDLSDSNVLTSGCRCLIAAYCGDVRLIDNLQLL